MSLIGRGEEKGEKRDKCKTEKEQSNKDYVKETQKEIISNTD